MALASNEAPLDQAAVAVRGDSRRTPVRLGTPVADTHIPPIRDNFRTYEWELMESAMDALGHR